MFQIRQLIRISSWLIAATMLFLVSCTPPPGNLPETNEPTEPVEPMIEAVIEVKDMTVDDDYLCWSPVPARIRLSEEVDSPVAVNLSSAGTDEGGAVWFQADDGVRPNRNTFSPTAEISLSLPGDGAWVSFWIAGQQPSTNGKDIRVVASDEAGNEVGTLPVMVRVRKDAETLTVEEREQLLSAIATVHDLQNDALDSEYYKHVLAHEQAFNLGIHGGPSGQPLFLVWHRAFLLNLERELQTVDPRVMLPYWRFDQPAPTMFTPEFIGVVEDSGGFGGFLVEFSPTNPLRGWRMNDERLGAFVRVRNAIDTAPIPEDRLEDIFAVPFNDQYTGVNGAIELSYHNMAHAFVSGWLGRGFSPADPLFFLLHANVDRAWAHWQSRLDRFEPTDMAAYSAQGSFENAPETNRLRKGSYAEDLMWPWNETGGEDGWPELTYPMPTVPGAEGPMIPPRPADMIDYLDVAGQGVSHGVCYDDIDYFGEPIGVEN